MKKSLSFIVFISAIFLAACMNSCKKTETEELQPPKRAEYTIEDDTLSRFVQTDTSLCLFQYKTLRANYTGFAMNFLWIPGGETASYKYFTQAGLNTLVIWLDSITTDTIRVTINDCRETKYVNMNEVMGDICIYPYKNIFLDAWGDSVYTYNWSNGGDTLQSYRIISSPGQYSITRFAWPSDTLVANVFDCSESYIYIPNSFSPEGTGDNETWAPRGYNISVYFEIRDDDGIKIFSSNDINKPWDGTYKGNYLPPGNYWYYIEWMGLDGIKHIEKGIVELIL